MKLYSKIKIFDTNSSFHLQVKDILVDDQNTIVKIEDNISPGKNDTEVIAGANQNIGASIGWFDFRANTGQPGFEQKEDLQTFSKAAIQGGFSTVMCTANTLPVIDTRSAAEFILNMPHGALEIIPSGAVTKGRKGEELAEMYDMNLSGVSCFYDGERTLNADILKKALLYTKIFDGVVIQLAYEPALSKKHFVNEGVHAMSVGLQGIPNIAESSIVARDLQILEYYGGRLHFANITTKESLALIKAAKAKGLAVTADTAIHYLILDDSTVPSFDQNAKVFPPFRSKEDVVALRKAVVDGTIDIICSDHTPQEVETKFVEFEYAAYGMSGLDTFYGLYQTYLASEIPLDVFLKAITTNPRKLVGKENLKIEAGQATPLTFFNADVLWEVTADNMHSKSKNTPFLGKTLKGKVLA